MEGVEDIPERPCTRASPGGGRASTSTSTRSTGSRDVDVGAQVPHGAVQLFVMGERGAAREAATAEEIGEMGRLVRDGVAAGAFGFSTSRTLNHRTSSGDPAPTFGAASAS